MKSSESLPIIYEPITGNFTCRLPVIICDHLSLSDEAENGILVCHKQKKKLEELVTKIMTVYTEDQILKDKSRHTQRRKGMTTAFILTLLIIAVFFTEPFFKNNPSLRLPFSIGGAIIAMYCFYYLLPIIYLEDYMIKESEHFPINWH